MSKPREWEIVRYWNDDYEVENIIGPVMIDKEYVKVIEKSAYDEFEAAYENVFQKMSKLYLDKKHEADKLAAEIECLAIMHEENLNELIKTKKALRDTANGRPSEWAYVQLKADADKLAEALENISERSVDISDASDIARQALKEYLGEK